MGYGDWQRTKTSSTVGTGEFHCRFREKSVPVRCWPIKTTTTYQDKTLVKRLKIKTPFKNSTHGKDWWQKLKERHPDLTIRKPKKTGSLRCRMMNRQKVDEYFKDLTTIMTEKKT